MEVCCAEHNRESAVQALANCSHIFASDGIVEHMKNFGEALHPFSDPSSQELVPERRTPLFLLPRALEAQSIKTGNSAFPSGGSWYRTGEPHQSPNRRVGLIFNGAGVAYTTLCGPRRAISREVLAIINQSIQAYDINLTVSTSVPDGPGDCT